MAKILIITTSYEISNIIGYEMTENNVFMKNYCTRNSGTSIKDYMNSFDNRDKSIFTKRPFTEFHHHNDYIIVCKDSSIDGIDDGNEEFLRRLISAFSNKKNNTAGLSLNFEESEVFFLMHFTADTSDLKDDKKPQKLNTYSFSNFKASFSDSKLIEGFDESKSPNSFLLFFSHSSNSDDGNFVHRWLKSDKDEVHINSLFEDLNKNIERSNTAKQNIEELKKGHSKSEPKQLEEKGQGDLPIPYDSFYVPEENLSSSDNKEEVNFFKVPINSEKEYRTDTKPILFICEPIDTTQYSKKTFFLDSSIWFRSTIKEADKELSLDSILLEIDTYKNRYKLINAIENKEFAIRQHEQSKLYEKGGHAAKVEPYIFHSELTIKNLIIDGLNDAKPKDEKIGLEVKDNSRKLSYLAHFFKYLNKNGLKKSIRIAICDDFADKALSEPSEKKIELIKPPKKGQLSKKDIIEENLKFVAFGENQKFGEAKKEPIEIYFENFIHLETYCSMDEIFESKKKFDIILLDYLFSYDIDGNVLPNPEYGTKLLEDLISKKADKQLPAGFLSTHWILPISAFSNSMINELQNKGITFTNDDIFLSLGADPITEPYLFLYELFFLINEQIRVSIGWAMEWEENYEKRINETISLIKDSTSYKLEEDRNGWIKKFAEISDVFSKITQLQIDSENQKSSEEANADPAANVSQQKGSTNSLLAEKLIGYLQDEAEPKIRILTHYRDLLYQLAFKSYQDNEIIFIEVNKLRYELSRQTKHEY